MEILMISLEPDFEFSS